MVFKIKEKGLMYCASSNKGKQWSEPVLLSSEISSSTRDAPRLFSHGNALLVLWRYNGFNVRTSSDNGTSWQDTRTRVFNDEVVGDYQMMSSGATVYFFYTNQNGIFFRRSDNFGREWTNSRRTFWCDDGIRCKMLSSSACEQDTLAIVWSSSSTEFGGLSAPRTPSLFFSRSTNKGESWGPTISINTDRTSLDQVYKDTFPLVSLEIVQCRSGLLTLYEERGLFLQWRGYGNPKWSQPVLVSRIPSRLSTVWSSDTTDSYVAWVDERAKEKDWWARIPMHEFLTWDKDPYWANNDLYVARIHNGNPSGETRMTLPLSYVSVNRGALVLQAIDKTLLVFWSGRKKVGKTLDEYGYPVEIFLSSLEMDSQ